MASLHIFNPSHDEALAARSPYYTPTRAARTLARDLCTLPTWWAEEGDYVLLPDEAVKPTSVSPDYSYNIYARGGGVSNIHYVYPRELTRLSQGTITHICPWGWDAPLAMQLKRMGIAPELLPTDDTLQAIRQLSSRRTVSRVLPMLRERVAHTVGESLWCTTMEAVERCMDTYRVCMLKAPWSCSGRGVFCVEAPMGEPVQRRVARILREQGGIEVQPFYQRVMDLALEFYMDEGLRYEGLSLFASTETGGYAGNLLLPEERLLQQLPNEICGTLCDTREALIEILTPLLRGVYSGPLGVDMMVVETEDGMRLHPCVEINLRNTMGRVACLLVQRWGALHGGRYVLKTVTEVGEADFRLTPHGVAMQAVVTR